MVPAVYDTVSADIEAIPAQGRATSNEAGRYMFRAQGQTLKFKGFTAVYVESREDDESTDEDAESRVPPMEEGEELRLLGLDPKQHFTQAPPRYTEASLIKALEELGIGRPSTYAQILGTIIHERGYVRRERRTLFPTELGVTVTEKLIPYFSDIMNVEFTAEMEDHLDKVEDGEQEWVATVKKFFEPFKRDLARAKKEMENEKKGTPTGSCARRTAVSSSNGAAASAPSSPAPTTRSAATPAISTATGERRTSPPTKCARRAASPWSSSTAASANSSRAPATPSARRPSR